MSDPDLTYLFPGNECGCPEYAYLGQPLLLTFSGTYSPSSRCNEIFPECTGTDTEDSILMREGILTNGFTELSLGPCRHADNTACYEGRQFQLARDFAAEGCLTHNANTLLSRWEINTREGATWVKPFGDGDCQEDPTGDYSYLVGSAFPGPCWTGTITLSEIAEAP